jgi:transposase
MTLPLPEPRPLRWTIRHKQAILDALREERLSRDEACARYELSLAELDQWLTAFAERGWYGLRVTRRRRRLV